MTHCSLDFLPKKQEQYKTELWKYSSLLIHAIALLISREGNYDYAQRGRGEVCLFQYQQYLRQKL